MSADEQRAGDSVLPDAGDGHDSAQMAHALSVLGQAIADGAHSDPVCAGYRALRAAAGGMKVEEVFKLADGALGLSTREIVVAAYARRWCFMCAKGTIPCEVCGGTAQGDDGRRCPACNGGGLTVCEFCKGTGWADRETIPRELRQDVLEKQIGAVRDGLRVLDEKARYFTPQAVAALNEPTRRRLIAWLLRLQVRLRDLVDLEAVRDEAEKFHMLGQADRVNGFLDLLRRS